MDINGNTKYRIVVNIIATGKYTDFVQPLIDSVGKYFLIHHDILINVFSNKTLNYYSERCEIKNIICPAYKFPEATLCRYEIMTSISYDTDYIFYLDADMLINDYVGDEILGDLIAVRHPGYFKGGGGSWEARPESKAYVKPADRIKYFCGGVQGGEMDAYLSAMIVMKEWIDEDLKNGIMPIFHDESCWNAYLINAEYKELNPTYCMPQAWAKRVYSRIQDMPAKILACEKDFNYYRDEGN